MGKGRFVRQLSMDGRAWSATWRGLPADGRAWLPVTAIWPICRGPWLDSLYRKAEFEHRHRASGRASRTRRIASAPRGHRIPTVVSIMAPRGAWIGQRDRGTQTTNSFPLAQFILRRVIRGFSALYITYSAVVMEIHPSAIALPTCPGDKHAW